MKTGNQYVQKNSLPFPSQVFGHFVLFAISAAFFMRLRCPTNLFSIRERRVQGSGAVSEAGVLRRDEDSCHWIDPQPHLPSIHPVRVESEG